MRYIVHGAVGLLVVLTGSTTASAEDASRSDTCRLYRAGTVLVLASDCSTETTVVIPDGYTLDGRGHTLRARDPADGSFSGPVVRSGGRTAHLRNLNIVADDLRAACHAASPVDDRLRAVLFENASGTITGVHVRAVRQSPMGCQEGYGIDVRTTGVRVGTDEERVLVAGCSVEGFQKTGILVVGAVEVGLYANRVTGGGPLDAIAQNGIHIARGAHGSIKLNRVSELRYAGSGWSAAGLLAQDAGPLDVALNTLEAADVGMWLERTSAGELHGNSVLDSEYAVVIDGQSGPASDHAVHHNRLEATDVGVLLLGAGATGSVLSHNRIDARSGATLELLGASGNTIE